MELAIIAGGLVALFQVGYRFTASMPKTRSLGTLIGIVAFVYLYQVQFAADLAEEKELPLYWSWMAQLLVAAYVTAIGWVVLPVLYWILRGPFQLIVSPFKSIPSGIKTTVNNSRDARQAKALEEARERIEELEGRPDALPENTDEVTRLSVEWNKERERILKSGDNNKREKLNHADAKYGKQLADLLTKQEGGHSG